MTMKKLTDNALLGEQGASLISLAISKMGFVWRPTSQHDTGIDGEIEIRDSATGAVSGLIIKVQSKALTVLPNDSEDGFDYWPTQADVEYWLGHNVPVILVVSRPATNDVFWQTVERPSGPTSPKKFHFSKSNDRLDASSKGDCRRRSNIDHLCRLNFDQGLLPAISMLTVDNYKSKVGIPVSLSKG